MSTVYKLLDFKWWDIDSILYLADSYNNTSGFDDSSQVVGGVSGIIRYNVLNTTFSTSVINYYWLIYFRQLPTQKNPPHTVGFRTDRWSTITARTGNHFQITHNGTTYWVYKSADVSYFPSTGKWQITSDNVDSNPVFVNEGTSKKNTVHDLGDKTGSTDQQIYLEGLQYLLNEPAQGKGTVTLSIKKPGQTLNFASRLLGKTVSQYISEDATIDMNESEPVMNTWNIVLLAYYNPLIGYINKEIVIDQNYNRTYGSTVNAGVSTDFLEQSSGSYTVNAKINSYIYCAAMETEAGETLEMTSYNAGDQITTITTSGTYDASKVIIASTIPVSTLPFEVCFMWHYSAAMVTTIIKRNGTKTTNSRNVVGEFITVVVDQVYAMNVTISAFTGLIKIFKNNDSIISMDASSGYSVVYQQSQADVVIIFAIPS